MENTHVADQSEIISGTDEVGAFLSVGPMASRKYFWYGTALSLQDVKKIGYRYSGPTPAQVAVGLLTSWKWLLAHPRKGIIFPESLDSDQILKWGKPYLGNVIMKQLRL